MKKIESKSGDKLKQLHVALISSIAVEEVPTVQHTQPTPLSRRGSDDSAPNATGVKVPYTAKATKLQTLQVSAIHRRRRRIKKNLQDGTHIVDYVDETQHLAKEVRRFNNRLPARKKATLPKVLRTPVLLPRRIDRIIRTLDVSRAKVHSWTDPVTPNEWR